MLTLMPIDPNLMTFTSSVDVNGNPHYALSQEIALTIDQIGEYFFNIAVWFTDYEITKVSKDFDFELTGPDCDGAKLSISSFALPGTGEFSEVNSDWHNYNSYTYTVYDN